VVSYLHFKLERKGLGLMSYRKTFTSSLVIFLSLMLSACHFGNSNNEDELDVVELIISLTFDVRNGSLDTIPKGYSQSLVAIATLRDGSVVDLSEEVTWHSTDTDVLVTNGNRITGANVGSASIYVTYQELTSNSVVLDVSDAVLASIQLTPGSVTLPLGVKQTYQALATFSDATVLDITNEVNWTINDPSIATVDEGELTSLQTGSAELTASLEGVSSNTALLEITDAELVSIQISAPVNAVMITSTAIYTALGNYNDGSSGDISSIVDWHSTDSNIATIVAGTAIGVAEGSVDITASNGTVTSDASSLDVEFLTLACGTDSAAGTCIKTITATEGDAAGKLFTGTPSVAALTAMGYSEDGEIDNTGTTYWRSFIGDGDTADLGVEFAKMVQIGLTTPQTTRFCEDLARRSFDSKTNWRQPTKDELLDLYDSYPSNQLFDDYGWAVDIVYWSSTEVTTNKSNVVNLETGAVFSTEHLKGSHRAVSCVSDAD